MTAGRLEGVLATVRDITSLAGLKFWTEESTGFAGIVGRDPKMVQIYRQIQRVAEHDYPVLITGETGTGKELVAAAIHSESRRHPRPLCAGELRGPAGRGGGERTLRTRQRRFFRGRAG